MAETIADRSSDFIPPNGGIEESTGGHGWDRLSASDRDFVLVDAVLQIMTTVDRELLAVTTMDLGQRLFGAAASGFFLFDGDGTFPHVVQAKDAAAGFVEEYEHGLRREDPVLRLVLKSGRAASARCAIAPDDWSKAAIAGHLKRWGFGDSMQGPLHFDGRIIGTVNVVRHRDDRPFGNGDLAALDRVCRALSHALAVNTRRASVASDGALTRPGSHFMKLEGRAKEVGWLVLDGATNKVIARQLGISELTAKEHVERLRARLGAINRTQLAAYLARHLVRPTDIG
jgi:DNA-binding CsgD family transcriptional regulator